jgi:hypothetical protein
MLDNELSILLLDKINLKYENTNLMNKCNCNLKLKNSKFIINQQNINLELKLFKDYLTLILSNNGRIHC